ncbi:MAG: hypothetical protein AVO39_10620 [delta proteobacterium MLS_D]|jgi:hypothetical protein|nr:MAG: hypothetical protein AVO39_10620 [delta proteobacterium MLS_D]
MDSVNIFTSYKQEENHFTNGLVSILRLSKLADPELVPSFLRTHVGIVPHRPLNTFRVLQGIKGTADGELCGEDCCIQFETKIVSAKLDSAQIGRHLDQLRRCDQTLKRLVLLTPDDPKSKYIEDFVSIDPQLIVHAGWRPVYEFLENTVINRSPSVFGNLVSQFLERIHDTVFSQDQAGIIQKIDFGDRSEVYEDAYLAEMKAGQWTEWNTPREYKSLDGTGRKLMLYDHIRKAITVEVEIARVERTEREPRYPWTNVFASGTLHVLEEPIPVVHIRSIAGFENFGVHRKDRCAYRNITHEQYRELTK